MSNAIVSNVYRYVIDDVISQVRGDFEDMGIDDSVLQELQRSWESKVARSRVANFGFKDENYYDEDANDNGDLNQANNNDVNSATNYNNYQQQQQQQQQPQTQLSQAHPQQPPQAQLPQQYAQYTQNYPTTNTMNTTNNVPQAASLANLALNASNNVTGMGFNRPQPQPYVLPPPLPLTQQQQPPLPPQQQQQQQSQPYQQSMMQPPRPLSQPLQQHPSQQLNLQLPGLQRNMNNNNNNNNNIPQNDGANDIEFASTEKIDKHIADIIQSSTVTDQEEDITFTAFSSGRSLSLESLPDHVKQLMKDAKERAFKAGALKKRELKRIPQLDGEGTEEEDHKPIVNEDEINTSTTAATDDNPSIAITTTASTTPSAAGGTKADEKDDYDLGSDLDDTDEDDDDAEGNEEIEHIILCLYDKVTRTKNKWKCILKDGIMLVNGRDYLFHRANGDFEW